MPLLKQLIPISFQSGLDTKTDPKQVIPGKLVELQNGQFTNVGAINKRPGYTQLSTNVEGGGTIKQALAVDSFRNEQLVFDGYSMYSYLPATGRWVNRGTAVSAVADSLDVIRQSTSQQLSPDMATLSGISAWAWEDSRGGLRYATRDTTTNAYVLPDSVLASDGYKPKLIPFAGLLCALYVTPGKIELATINPATPTVLSARTAIVSNLADGYRAYDAAVIGSQLYVAYMTTTDVYVISLNTSLAQTASFHFAATPTGGIIPMSVSGDASGNVWIGYFDGTNINAAIVNSTLTGFVFAASIITTPPSTVSTLAIIQDPKVAAGRFFYEVLQVEYWESYVGTYTLSIGGVLSPDTVLVRSVGIAAKPFVYHGDLYLPLSFDTSPSALQNTYFLLRTASNTIVTRINTGLGGGHITNHLLPESQNIGAGQYTFANLVKGGLDAEGGVLFSLLGVNATTITFNNANALQKASPMTGLVKLARPRSADN